MQAKHTDVCQSAEAQVMAALLRDRLTALAIDPTPDLAVGLMAVAMLLAERTAEFGGDARDALGAVALLGLDLLGDEPT